MAKCDKCGREVKPKDDVVELLVEIHNIDDRYGIDGIDALLADCRHLLPVLEGEKVVCPGSPSNAQYLLGEPRDTRPGMPAYDPKWEELYRQAYARLQAGE